MADIKDALDFGPFDGDFGDGEVTLSDKIVTGRKDYENCHTCGGVCRAGTKHRVLVERDGSGLTTYRWCEDCTQAMADELEWYSREPDEDDGHHLGPHERRINLHRPKPGTSATA